MSTAGSQVGRRPWRSRCHLATRRLKTLAARRDVSGAAPCDRRRHPRRVAKSLESNTPPAVKIAGHPVDPTGSTVGEGNTVRPRTRNRSRLGPAVIANEWQSPPRPVVRVAACAQFVGSTPAHWDKPSPHGATLGGRRRRLRPSSGAPLGVDGQRPIDGTSGMEPKPAGNLNRKGVGLYFQVHPRHLSIWRPRIEVGNTNSSDTQLSVAIGARGGANPQGARLSSWYPRAAVAISPFRCSRCFTL